MKSLKLDKCIKGRGIWKSNKVFIRLMHGFCLDELYCPLCIEDCVDCVGHDKYKEKYDFINEPCRNAIFCFLCIRKYRRSILNTLPKEIMQIIVHKVWKDRSTFLSFEFETHHRYMYGHRDTDTYIGFTYDIIPSIFDTPSFVYGGEYCISNAAPPHGVVETYKKFFPKYIPSSIYILDGDIYTSHYVHGDIMYGFFFNISYEGDEIHKSFLLDENKFDIRAISHNLNCKYKYFVGVTLNSIDGVEIPDTSIENGKKCHEKYNFKYMKPISHLKNEIIKHILKHAEDVTYHTEDYNMDMHEYPILGFIPQMCYCCT